MFIIFDLDDTLVDTWGSIAPHVLRCISRDLEGCKALFPHELSRDRLLRLGLSRSSLVEGLREFCRQGNVPWVDFDFARGKRTEASRLPLDIAPVRGAREVLRALAKRYHIGLVTRGKEEVQREKMRRAGIDAKAFSSLYFCPGEKGEAYRRIGERWGLAPSEVVVCGDRISFDLSPAKALGYRTVQMKWGRGWGDTGRKSDVDYTIFNLVALKRILRKLHGV